MRCIVVGYGVQGKKRLAVAASEAAGVVEAVGPRRALITEAEIDPAEVVHHVPATQHEDAPVA